MVDKNKVLAALRETERSYIRSANENKHDGILSEAYRMDARDVGGIRAVYEMTGDFPMMIESVMHLDTIVREQVLMDLAAAVGKEVVEATGQVIYL